MNVPRAFFILTTVVLAGYVLSGCPPLSHETTVQLDPYRPECPHDWPDSLRFGSRDSVGPMPAYYTGPGPIRNVPEFHDCQRFIDREGGAEHYDSLFAIFATYRLTRLDTLMQLARGDSLMQLARGDSLKQMARGDSLKVRSSAYEGLTAEMALPAAEIVAWNDYDSLGIHTGFNCLYLYLRNETGGGLAWKARMVSFGKTERDCSLPIDPDTLPATAKELLVRPSANPRLTSAADYPPVARWEWDDRAGIQYIGIRCGSAWCAVTPGGVSHAPTYASTLPDKGASLSQANFRVMEVKGWYDAQYLAVPTSAGQPARPSRIRGVIIPDPRLGEYNKATDFDSTWVHTASVALDVPTGVTNPYATEFNLQATPAGADGSALNQVFLCHATATKGCEGVPAGTPVCPSSTGWWVKVVDPAGRSMYRCSTRRDMGSVSVPATVRWRWLLNDEGMWMRCINGCCEMQGT